MNKNKKLRMMNSYLPQPDQSISTLLFPSVAEQPQWRLGDPPEREEEEDVEEWRN